MTALLWIGMSLCSFFFVALLVFLVKKGFQSGFNSCIPKFWEHAHWFGVERYLLTTPWKILDLPLLILITRKQRHTCKGDFGGAARKAGWPCFRTCLVLPSHLRVVYKSGSRRTSPASLPGFAGFMSQDMSRRWCLSGPTTVYFSKNSGYLKT